MSNGRRMVMLCLFWVVASATQATAQKAPPLNLSALFQPRYKAWIRSHPDQFSWMVFALIAQRAPQRFQSRLPNGTWTNNAVWETWADDDRTFPSAPDHAPAWDCRPHPSFKKLHKDSLMEILARKPLQPLSESAAMLPIPRIPADAGGEEVRRNCQAFQSIVGRGLWYEEGQQRWFARHASTLRFDRGSIEIKAVWQPVTGDENSNSPYHLNYLENGTPYKLVSLHISTNALPQWTWATWEWVDNPDRCQQSGCSDAFGADPAFVQSIDGQLKLYPAGKLKRRLQADFKRLNLGCEWTGYRLKGSQVLRNGKPTKVLLGNSNMEGLLLPTASCIACHARARVYPDGKADCSRGFKPGTREGYTDFPTPSEVQPRTTSFVWAFSRASRQDGGGPVCGP